MAEPVPLSRHVWDIMNRQRTFSRHKQYSEVCIILTMTRPGLSQSASNNGMSAATPGSELLCSKRESLTCPWSIDYKQDILRSDRCFVSKNAQDLLSALLTFM